MLFQCFSEKPVPGKISLLEIGGRFIRGLDLFQLPRHLGNLRFHLRDEGGEPGSVQSYALVLGQEPVLLLFIDFQLLFEFELSGDLRLKFGTIRIETSEHFDLFSL